MAEICLIDNTEHKSTISLCRYLKKLGISNKEYYDKYLKQDNDGICKECGNENLKFVKFGYVKYCNTTCSKLYISKYFKTLKRKPMSQETKDKLSKSWENRDSSWIDKRKITIENKYGMTYTEFKRMQFVKRLESMSDKEKLEFYDNAVSKQGLSKSVKYKNYKLGEREILVQGYEPYVLDVIQQFYTENEIDVSRSKHTMIRYIGIDGKSHRYFPDIFLPNKVLIEVKSLYTLMNNFDTTILKFKAAYDIGYKPILVIWETDSERMEMCKNSLIETISSQAWNCTGRFNDYPFIGVGYKQTVSEVLRIHDIGL